MRRAAWHGRTLIAIAALTLVLSATATAQPQKTGSLTQVGHEPLMSRGMNAAGASTATTCTSGVGPTEATRTYLTAAS